jgi:hypothetical protein
LALGKKIIGKTFINQIQSFLPYIAFYRNEESSQYCDNVIELYKQWGGVIGHVLERIK